MATAEKATSKEAGVSFGQVATYQEARAIMRRGILTRRRTLWVGAPGVGKTAVVNSVGDQLGMPVVTIIGAISDPVDIGGLPVVTERKIKTADGKELPFMTFAPRDFLVRLNEFGGIIFFDELTSAPPATMAAMLRAADDLMFNEYQLDRDRVGLLAACNPPDVAVNGQELPPPVANRFSHYLFPSGGAAVTEWAENFPSYWGAPPKLGIKTGKGELDLIETAWIQARSLVASFVFRHQELWLNMPKEASARGGAWCSPRSWDKASRSLAAFISDGLPPHEALMDMTGDVGSDAALQFHRWVKEFSLPDPLQLLKHPDTFYLSGRPDVDYATLMSVAAVATTGFDLKMWDAAAIICRRAADGATKSGKNTPATEQAMPAFVTLCTAFTKATPPQKSKLQGFWEKNIECTRPFYKIMIDAGIMVGNAPTGGGKRKGG